MKTAKRTAPKAYTENNEQAHRLLVSIAAGLAVHCACTIVSLDWGDVGDLQRLNELLTEADRFINDKED